MVYPDGTTSKYGPIFGPTPSFCFNPRKLEDEEEQFEKWQKRVDRREQRKTEMCKVHIKNKLSDMNQNKSFLVRVKNYILYGC